MSNPADPNEFLSVARAGIAVSGDVIRRVGELLMKIALDDDPLSPDQVRRMRQAMALLENHGKEVGSFLDVFTADSGSVH